MGFFRRTSDVFAPAPTVEPDLEEYEGDFAAIYKCETVDRATVRLMGSSAPKPVESVVATPMQKPAPVVVKLAPISEVQGLGDVLCEDDGVDAMELYEPVQILPLSERARNLLLENGIYTVQMLMQAVEQGLQLKGLGQGYVDEVVSCLKTTCQGKPLYHLRVVHFASFVRCVVGSLDRVSVSLALQPYGLQGLLPLTPAQAASTRHLSADGVLKMRQAAEEALLHSDRIAFVRDRLAYLAERLVLPWVRKRGGLVTEAQLAERTRQLSVGQNAEGCCKFLSEVYGKRGQLFSGSLIEVSGSLLAVSGPVAVWAEEVVQRTGKYFYQEGLSYNYSQLIQLLETDFARSWKTFPEGFIARVLSAHPAFFTYIQDGQRRLARR